MAASPSLRHLTEKKPWWLTTKKVVDKYMKDAKFLISTRDQLHIISALNLLDSALILSPTYEPALELKARCLLHLRRFKDVADMLQDYIPSFKLISSSSDSDDSSGGSSVASSQPLSRDRVKLLRGGCDSFRHACFSVSDLKNRVLSGLCKRTRPEGHWRYIALGEACCHIGLMEDAMALLQTGKRLAADELRRRSNSQSEDSFSSPIISLSEEGQTPPTTESESVNSLIAQIKLLLRRRGAAVAALDAGFYSESIRHFSKLLDGRRPAPQAFLAGCHLQRSSAYRAAGRVAESIADANKALALDPSSVSALIARASLFEVIGCLTDSVHDLEHAKLLLNSILRDRKAPGVPTWRTGVRYREIPGRLCQVSAKIQRLKSRLSGGEICTVDYNSLMGVGRGCSRSELERSHIVLALKHKPDRSIGFVERCEFGSEAEREEARERARMSAVLLYRLMQKGYSSLSSAIAQEERAENERRRVAWDIQRAQAKKQAPEAGFDRLYKGATGSFCRDILGFNIPITVKYEALIC